MQVEYARYKLQYWDKSLGIDNINAEMLQASMEASIGQLQKLFSKVLNNNKIPTDWK